MSNKEITKIIEESPSVRLIGNRNRNFIIQFFYYSFSNIDERAVSFERIFRDLSEYIEKYEAAILDEEDDSLRGFENYESRAKNFLRKWISNGFLTNFLADNGDEYVELSAHAQKAMDWLVSLKKKEFVGTESKFKSIIGQLKDLVENTEEDRQKRLEALKEKKLAIVKEIELIESGKALFVYEDYQIESRLENLNQSAKELISDFKEVEHNFKSITKSIYQKYADADKKKDEILAYTFDALDEIKKSDQGRSFYAFYAYLLQNSSQDIWESYVSDLYNKLKAKDIKFSDLFLKRMSRYLYRAGKDVFAANDKMAEKLGRVIGDKDRPDNQAFRKLLSEVKSLAASNDSRAFTGLGIDQDTKMSLRLSMERPINLNLPKEEVYKAVLELADGEVTESEQLVQLLSKKTINLREMRSKVKDILEAHPNISLEVLIEKLGGIHLGLGEVLAYMNILKFFKHKINETETFKVPFQESSNKFIELPKITLRHDGAKK